MRIFDSHAHIDHVFFGDGVEGVIARAMSAGVERIVSVGSSADVSLMDEAVGLANTHDGVYAAVGVHPHSADQTDSAVLGHLRQLATQPKVVAIGEAGLDFHYDFSARESQRDVFVAQIELAVDVNKPLVIHCREAHAEMLQILQERRLPTRPGVIHCFTGDEELAGRYLDLGFYLSIPGVVTFKNAGDLIGAIKMIPIERLLVETDSPYLAPVPFRGRPNEPAYVVRVVEAIAQILDVPVAHVAETTFDNACRLFDV